MCIFKCLEEFQISLEILQEMCGGSKSRSSQNFTSVLKVSSLSGRYLRQGCPRTSTDNTSATIIGTILEEEGCMICDEIAVGPGIPRLSVHHVLTEGLDKWEVAACSMTVQDLTSH